MTSEPTPENVLRATTRFVLRNRAMTKFLALSLIIDVALTVGVAWNTVHFHTITLQSQHVLCVSANRFRADEKRLWEHVLTITADPHPTPSQAQMLGAFRLYLDQAMAPRYCGPK